jgi:hypothetical protein
MPKTAAKITQAEISRIFRAADKAGFGLVIEIRPDGTMRFIQSNKPANISALKHEIPKPKTLF